MYIRVSHKEEFVHASWCTVFYDIQYGQVLSQPMCEFVAKSQKQGDATSVTLLHVKNTNLFWYY